jgi:hypothetical protein
MSTGSDAVLERMMTLHPKIIDLTLDRVTHRKKMREELVTILRMLSGQSPAIVGDLPAPAAVPAK